jgi:hypothetical protein
MQNIAGSPVEGADFYGREAIIRSYWEFLDTHDILLLGPRRTGKTSLARRLMAEAARCGWRAMEVNVADCPDERAVVDKLAAAVNGCAGSWIDGARESLGALLDRVRGIRLPMDLGGVDLAARPEESWTAVAGDLLALLTGLPGKTLIYIDELPIFLYNLLRNDRATGEQRVRRFLDWFRNDARQVPGGKNLHWLVSGSVGLDTLVQRRGMADTINTLSQRTLKPFERGEALDFLETMATSYNLPFTPADREHLLDAIGWPQPYYLQLCFQTVRFSWRRPQPLRDAIDAALEALIEPGADNDFHHWEERLHIQLDESDATLAIALLKLACRDRRGATATALFSEAQGCLSHIPDSQQERHFTRLRDVLVRDGYWLCDDSDGPRRYRFCLEPLRRWWLRSHTL